MTAADGGSSPQVHPPIGRDAAADSKLWHPFADMATVRRLRLMIERGDDVWVVDADGRRYLDATASLWYANVGHGRREIVDAISDQLQRLEAYATFGDFSNRPAEALAVSLSDRAPMPCRVFLTSGGGDAIDTAAKIARRFFYERGEAERSVFVSRTCGYHGTHGYGTALSGIAANRHGFGPQVETEQVPFDSVDDLRAALVRLGPERVAAFFLEPVIGAGGVLLPPPGYIEAVADVCADAGVLVVVDAVVCGFGRLGRWFGIERWEVTPDMVVFAKGVTSGYLPLGGVLVSERVAKPFWETPGGPVLRHGPTYAGHPACCAAALANIEVLEAGELLQRGETLEGRLLGALKPLAERAEVAEVRGGIGLLAAVELDAELLAAQPDAVVRVATAARKQGVLVRPLSTCIAVSPPLTVRDEHLELIASAIERALEPLRRSGRSAA